MKEVYIKNLKMDLFIQFFFLGLDLRGSGTGVQAVMDKAYRQMCGEASSNCRHGLFVAAQQTHM